MPLGFEVNMLNPSFLLWNSAVSLLVGGNVMVIHITVPTEISVKASPHSHAGNYATCGS